MADEATLLPFQRSILSELVPTESNPNPANALLILARGLGLRAIVSNILRVFDSPTQLVLVLNATEEEEKGFQEETNMKLKCISYELSAAVRNDLYKSGGICSVTSRILVVDMLTGKVPVDLITGIIVLHADTVTPTSLESFIVRIYRKTNKTGFLKAFSDEPEAFTYGISPLQTVLTQLNIRTVHIWPRFRNEVAEDLVKRKADVVELHQPLSDSMKEVQNAVIECMEATLNEIKRSNHSLDVDDLTVENALFKSFDVIVRRQLDPVWHSVGPKTKQLVFDLTTLRKLQAYLLAFDCVSFNRFLETILSSNSTNPLTGKQRKDQSPWLFTAAAETIFSVSRNRVYLQTQVDKNGKALVDQKDNGKGKGKENEKEFEPASFPDQDYFNSIDEEELLASMENFNEPIQPLMLSFEEARRKAEEREAKIGIPPGVEPILEEQPKWNLLSDVLEEIEKELHWSAVDVAGVANDTILILCSSSSICNTLKEYLTEKVDLGEEIDETKGRKIQPMMMSKLKEYFWWKIALGRMQKNLKKTYPSNISNSKAPSTSTEVITNPALKRKAELSAAATVKGSSGPPRGKRRRVRGGGNVGADSSNSRVGQQVNPGSDAAAFETDNLNLAELMTATSADIAAPDYVNATEHISESFDEVAFDDYFGLLSNETLVIIRPYTGDDDDKVLEELRPKYIVMYDPDPSYVRRIECFRAAHQGLAIRVYFMMYTESVEEQRYLSAIRKEKDAFTKLIREKETMAIPLEAEFRPGEEIDGELLRTVSSRVGGKEVRSGIPKVIVDVREFRSSLPSLLHAGAFDVIPLTITIGDYIITPEMCVERKSLPDLISSFNSGRLYQQCELMTAHYKQPILLIEFDEKKSFSLDTYSGVETKSKYPNQNAGNSDNYASDTDLRSKLVLLTITFPRLRTIWSSSPFHTVQIFKDLKENNDEPDPVKALLVGADESVGGIRGEGSAESAFNQTPQELLRSLPGVTTGNFRYIMSKVENLEKLVELELSDIQELIGVEPGKVLYNFMNNDVTLAEMEKS